MHAEVSISCIATPAIHGNPPPPSSTECATVGHPAVHVLAVGVSPARRSDHRARGRVVGRALGVADAIERRDHLGAEGRELREDRHRGLEVRVLEPGHPRVVVGIDHVLQDEADVAQRCGVRHARPRAARASSDQSRDSRRCLTWLKKEAAYAPSKARWSQASVRLPTEWIAIASATCRESSPSTGADRPRRRPAPRSVDASDNRVTGVLQRGILRGGRTHGGEEPDGRFDEEEHQRTGGDAGVRGGQGQARVS